MKKCSKCKEEKNRSEFGKDKYRPDGLCCQCKQCKKLNRNKQKKKEYYLQHRKDKLEKQRIYQESHKEYRKIYNKEYGRKYHINKKNDPKYIYVRYKSDAKRRKIDFNLSLEDFMTFLNGTCKYCGQKLDRVRIDRVDNSLGYSLDNCVPCCYICNVAKNNLHIDNWLEYLEQIIVFYLDKEIRHLESEKKLSYKKQFTNYRLNAKRKNIFFGISYEDFLCFQNKPCIYCGTIVNGIIGIDRTNNDIGYKLTNCASCCKTCNYGKGNRSLEEWQAWLDKIILYRVNNNGF